MREDILCDKHGKVRCKYCAAQRVSGRQRSRPKSSAKDINCCELQVAIGLCLHGKVSAPHVKSKEARTCCKQLIATGIIVDARANVQAWATAGSFQLSDPTISLKHGAIIRNKATVCVETCLD